MDRTKTARTTRTEPVLQRGIAEVIDREHLQRRLDRGDRLRVKLGIDPTGARLHLGHAVALRVLRRFQDLGHTVVLIVGDFTASIGDPSGKNETRPALTADDIRRNYRTYEQQALKILKKDTKLLEVRYQTEWYKKFTLDALVREASRLSVGWLLSHETFRHRMKNAQPLAFHELFYPMLQAYDSVVVRPDVEIGGLDQKFNLLTGRELMRSHGMPPQDVVLTRYLMGTDGQKMGKSLNNFIALNEEPDEMFGKIMSLPDMALRDYFELATDVPMDEVDAMRFSDVAARDAKLKLAETVVRMYHGIEKSKRAATQWQKFLKGVTHAGPVKLDDVPDGSLLEMLFLCGVKSKSEAQRLVRQGGVKVNGAVIADPFHKLVKGDAVTFGKRKTTHTLT